MSEFEMTIAAVSITYVIFMLGARHVIEKKGREQIPTWVHTEIIERRQPILWMFVAYAAVVFFQSLVI